MSNMERESRDSGGGENLGNRNGQVGLTGQVKTFTSVLWGYAGVCRLILGDDREESGQAISYCLAFLNIMSKSKKVSTS